MDRLFRDIIFGILFAAGGLTPWILKGFRTSMMEELFADKYKNRNGLNGLCLFVALIALAIYVNNR